MAAPVRSAPPVELLRQAHYAARLTTPFEDAMRDPLLAHVLELHARALMRGHAAPATTRRHAPRLDVKRLAAGDDD